jgi:hypothetical protein
MPFVHPLIFWSGLAAVSVPVIIHLLNRRRFRTRRWAAMKFLLDSLRKNRRRLRMEELILLLLRCLVVLMLGVAVARFTGCSAMEAMPFGGGESEGAVFIVDDSYSMGQRTGAGAVFASATAELAEQLRLLTGSAKVAVLTTSYPRDGGKLPEAKPVTDIQSVVNYLKDRRLSDTPADFAEALKAAKTIFSGIGGPKRLYLQSDFRRVDLARPDRAQQLRQLFDELRSSGVNIVAADYGTEATDNLTIERAAVAGSDSGNEGFVLAGVPFRVRVTVRNNSPNSAGQVKVKLAAKFASDRDPRFHAIVPDETISSIAPGRTESCEFKVTCSQACPVVLRAELPADELGGDNIAYLALDVHQAIRALIVDDRKDSADPEVSESYFLRAALQPGGEEIYGCRAETVASGELAGKALDDYDLVILLNVAEFPVAHAAGSGGKIECRQADELARYVRAGGGLAIFTGDRVEPRFYNPFLHAEGQGLCPYSIGYRQGDPKQADKYFRMKVVEDAAARNARGNLMRFGRVADTDTTELMRFYAFTPATMPKSLDSSGKGGPAADLAIVLARFDDPAGSPAVVLRPFGRGKVLMYYTTANRRWTDWPAYGADSFYVTAMNDMARFLARPQDRALNALAGEPFEFNVPLRLRGCDAQLAGLGEGASGVSLRWEKVDEHLRYETPAFAQGYAITFNRAGRDAATVFFARGPDPAEGELAPGGRAALDSVIGGKYEYTRRQANGKPQALWSKPAREYWTWALAGMLVFLAVETYLARKFGHHT